MQRQSVCDQSISIPFSVGLLLVLVTAASGQPERRDNFTRWDRNQDGKLVREELPEALRRNFDRVDADKDGFISRQEHEAFVALAARPGQLGQRRGAAIPDEVTAERDIPYANTDHPRQRLDLYVPKNPKDDKLPLIVFIHGGGWRNGDKAGGGRQVLPYVRTGQYVGASIGYRLSGDAVWPAQIYDCKAAIRWLRGNAHKYGINPDRIGVMGTSAGGHLVALLGTSGAVGALEGELGEFPDTSSRVNCVVDFFGPANLLTMGDFPSSIDHNAANSPESLMLGGAVQEHPDRARQASPQSHITADDPPFLILHGTDDKVVPYDQSVQFDKSLRAAGVNSVLIRVEKGGHGGFNTPEIDARVRAFFDRHLWGDDTDISAEPVTAPPR